MFNSVIDSNWTDIRYGALRSQVSFTSCFNMAVISAVLVTFCIFSTVYIGDCANYQPGAIQLTEDTWQDILQGEWMVELYVLVEL